MGNTLYSFILLIYKICALKCLQEDATLGWKTGNYEKCSWQVLFIHVQSLPPLLCPHLLDATQFFSREKETILMPFICDS